MSRVVLAEQKDKRTDAKGFTLVELIVVLVILAILAAILVPALLGWIDNAKAEQDMLNARNCMMATQAELTELYAFAREGQAKGTNLSEGETQQHPTVVKNKYGINTKGDVDVKDTDFAKAILKTADEDPYLLIVGLGRKEEYEETDLKKAFTVYVAIYMKTKDSKPLYYNGSEWTRSYLEKEENKNVYPQFDIVYAKGNNNKLISNGVLIQYYEIANKSGKPMTGNQVWNYLRNLSK